MFAEPVLGRLPEALVQPKLQERWCDGLWLGKSNESDGHIVGTPSAVFITRAIRPSGEREDQIFERMDWAPWGKFEKDDEDEEDPEEPKKE